MGVCMYEFGGGGGGVRAVGACVDAPFSVASIMYSLRFWLLMRSFI